MHNRKLHRIANDQRLAKGAEGANPHKEEANTDRAGLKHPFGVDLGDAGSLPADQGAVDVVRVIPRHCVRCRHPHVRLTHEVGMETRRRELVRKSVGRKLIVGRVGSVREKRRLVHR